MVERDVRASAQPGRVSLIRVNSARAAVACVILVCGATGLGVAAPCSLSSGARVVLASDAVDPDVFLWDSRGRLVDYAAGRWSSTLNIFAHTMLAPSGTEAIVVACAPGAAHLKYSSLEQDVIGVKITRGQFKGRYGWVLSSDTHPSR